MYIKHDFEIENNELILVTKYGTSKAVYKCTRTKIQLSELNLGNGGGNSGQDNYLQDVYFDENEDSFKFKMLNGNILSLPVSDFLEFFISEDANNVLQMGSDFKLKVIPDLEVRDAFNQSLFNAFQ